MYKLFGEAFKLFLTAIYINSRGESDTKTMATGEIFSYSCDHHDGLLKFTSEEFRHVTKFSRWYLPKHVRYTYLVSVIKESEGLRNVIEVFPMPMLCSKKFAQTTLPHRLAISECLHRFIPD